MNKRHEILKQKCVGFKLRKLTLWRDQKMYEVNKMTDRVYTWEDSTV